MTAYQMCPECETSFATKDVVNGYFPLHRFKFGETGYANIGSMYEPCAYRDACDPESHRTL